MGRIILSAAAILLLATAAIHALGLPMVAAWTRELGEQQRAGLGLVGLTDSIDWAVVAALWALAAWKRERPYLVAAAIAAFIPAAMAVGVMRFDPTFFGGWMLIGSLALAGAGIGLGWRRSTGVA